MGFQMVLWRNGECCRVGMGEALLCLSALLCQSAPQLVINKNCYLNLKLAQMLHIWWGVFGDFFFPPPQSQDILLFFAENWIKGERLMARTSAASHRHPCAMPPGSHTQNNLWKLLTGHLHAQTSAPALQHPLPNPASPNTGRHLCCPRNPFSRRGQSGRAAG